ncbi:MAG: AAA family ATPase [Dehalococcoidia bacterium]|nr:AAA family ATPase [Dehalococcoidia bacterium]
MRVLILTGPSGVGKTTVAYEVARQLASAGVAHALIDTDHLDMVHPQPEGPALWELTRRNLAAVWGSFAEIGHDRLVLSMVMPNAARDLPYIERAVPGADILVVRLRASSATRRERLATREVGSGLDDHLASSERAARYIEQSADGWPVVETDGRSVIEVARDVIALSGWVTA